jgi:lysophospholipase L1-like esterase
MTHHARPLRLAILVGFGILSASAGCGEGGEQPVPDGGTPPVGGAGGSVGSGGTASTGGTTSSDGTASTGGATAGTGGSSGSGGTTSAGGRSAGGTTSAGGRSAGGTTGGASGRGGVTSAGGSLSPADGSPPPDASPSPEAGTETGGGTPGVRLEGRFDMSDATKPSFGWSGSAMIARFQGTGASLRIDQSPNQYTVVVDGTVSSTVLKTGSGASYPLATGLAAGVHDVVVWRRTEGNQGESRFLGIDVTGGQLLAPPAAPDRRIEIYGDSITAGYGIDGAGPSCPFSADTENHYVTYGAIAARELKAELHTIAWSGIGMYRNYDETAASPDAMPAVYARTLPTKSGSAWDFKTWQPHAVVINLGTNDASTSGDPGTPYRTAYLEFVRTLRQRYPDTFFVLTIGPMLDGSSLTAIKTHLQAVIQTRAGEGDSKLSFLEFPVQAAADGYGCDWHPSPKTNAKMATLLVAELRKQLGW